MGELGPDVWSTRCQNLGHTWVQAISWQGWRQNDWQKNKHCGKQWFGSQNCNARGKCSYSVQHGCHHLAHSATLPDRHLRSWSRPWHDAGHGEVVGWVRGGQRSTGPCMSHRFSADAVGWFGHEVGSPHVSGGTLGFLGRCPPHDSAQFVTALSGDPLGEGCFWVNCSDFVGPPGFRLNSVWASAHLQQIARGLVQWQHGWQFHASSSSEHFFRETVVLTQSCTANQAHLRSFWTGIM